uniref:Ig-like domain-containing protein n=1 Tax=Gopherus agassizii TaxID=38772 RepID=A0A452GN72_9SAUR
MSPHLTPVCLDCAGVCLMACPLLTAELSYPKPSISLSPRGEVVLLGGNVIFRCVGGQPGLRFVLYRSGHPVNMQDPSGNEAEFPIPSMGPGNRGSYTCRYYTISQTPDWSEPSDPVELVVAGEGLGAVSPFPAPKLGKPCGVSVSMGPSEPGSALSHGPSRTAPLRGVRTESLGGSQPLEIRC